MQDSFLSISSKNGLKFIKEKDILYAISEGNYTTLYLINNQQFISTKKLKDLTLVLSFGDFFRIHHSHLINLHHLIEYKNGKRNYVVMKNGKELDVSKRKLSGFLNLFKKL